MKINLYVMTVSGLPSTGQLSFQGAYINSAAKDNYMRLVTDILYKRILILQSPVACQVRLFSPLSRETYTLCGSQGRYQILRTLEFPILSLSFVPVTLVKEGQEFLLKAPIKNSSGLGPIKSALSRSPQPRGSYRKTPLWGSIHSKQLLSFSPGRGKSSSRDSRGHFRPHTRTML